MSRRRPETRLTPWATLPRGYRELHVLHSTVDACGRAHWLLTERCVDRWPSEPYDAMVVTVGDGSVHDTQLSAVLPVCHRMEALPDGGFVLAGARARRDEQHVQVFDALGRSTWTFRVGDAVEHLLVDEAGDLWVGYFDEGIYGDDELSLPGLRRWSSTGEPLWAYRPGPGLEQIDDCYALNVSGRAAWACPYMRFPLLEIRGNRVVRVRTNPVRGSSGFAVHGDRLVFFGQYGRDRDRIVECHLTADAVVPGTEGRLVRPDGGPLTRRRRVVCRGPRLYLQEEPFTEWSVLDIT